MPDKYGFTHVVIPKEMMRDIVIPAQRRIFDETGEIITHGLVVRRLVEKGFAAETQECHCQLHSAN